MSIYNHKPHVEITLFWIKLFRRVAKRTGTAKWQLGQQTLGLLNAVTANDSSALHTLSVEREHHMFWAINRKLGKVVQVYCEIPNFNSDYAYLERWDPDFDNYPYLTFIGHNSRASFDEFEKLFTRFLTVNDSETYTLFKQYLHERYNAH